MSEHCAGKGSSISISKEGESKQQPDGSIACSASSQIESSIGFPTINFGLISASSSSAAAATSGLRWLRVPIIGHGSFPSLSHIEPVLDAIQL